MGGSSGQLMNNGRLSKFQILSILATAGVLFLITTTGGPPLYIGGDEHQLAAVSSQQLSSFSSGASEPVPDQTNRPFAGLRRCIQQSIEAFRSQTASPSLPNDLVEKERQKTVFGQLALMVSSCIAQKTLITAPDDFDQFRMGRFGERKYFLKPKSGLNYREWPQNELPQMAEMGDWCRFLTIGIGGDSQVEKEFHQKYPYCPIFGIEPSTDQYSDFQRYGTVINAAVGTNYQNATLKLRQKQKYRLVKVRVTPLSRLLDEFVGRRLVAYATMDIEGFEYRLLPEFFSPGGRFAMDGINICQLDVELHALHEVFPPSGGSMDSSLSSSSSDPTGRIQRIQFMDGIKNDDKDSQTSGGNLGGDRREPFDFIGFMSSLLSRTSFIPIHAETFLKKHQKLTLINAEHPECLKRFDFLSYDAQQNGDSSI